MSSITLTEGMRAMLVRRKVLAIAAASCVAMAGALTGCGDDSGEADKTKLLTYWASQQSPSVERDKEILAPELDKFTKQTGIQVRLEVIPFTQLLNKILTATTSGQGPDVINIGNTWSPSLQATGALKEWDSAMMDKIGGAARFEPAALQTTGEEGKTAAAVPLYNKVYQLYYNKRLFAEAGVTRPPATWDEFVTTAKKLTKDTNRDGKPDQWGLAVRGQASTVAAHYAFILGAGRGAQYFDGHRPTFDSTSAVDGISQYLSWMGKDKIVNPSDAENADWADVYEAFAGNKAAMMLVQTLGGTLKDYKLTEKDYGVAPMPTSGVSSGQDIGSFVGGTNVAIFKFTDNEEGAVGLVKFLTSAPEQSILNAAYGTVPAVKDATGPAFDTAEMRIARETIARRAIPMPRVPQEAQFETLIGADVVNWLAATATGKQPTAEQISAALKAAGEKVSAGG
jgi:multiple sugar transport system substrate-binding protein